MKRQLRLVAIASLMIVGMSAVARAQTATDAGTALKTLIGLGFPDGDSLVPVVFNLIQTEVATFPTASSSAGFTYAFDPQLGIPVLATKSFGPMFVERPNTAGRGRFAMSLDFQHTSWRSLDGFNLKGGGVQGHTGASGFSQAFIDLRTSIAVVGMTAGLTGRVDVGVSVPYITTTASGTYTTYDGRSAGSVKGISSGIGDVTLRAKAHLIAAPRFGLAAAVEEHLPTGNADKLLGLGKAATKLLVIAEEHGDKVSHHLNFGYTFAGAGAPAVEFGFLSGPLQPSDEINYSGGVDVAAASRVTITGDIVGRVLRHGLEIVNVFNGFLGHTFQELVPHDRRTLLVGVASVKVNVSGQWLIRANILFPLTANGLEPGITPVIGFERAF
jgi:hypothetical protein